MSRSHCSVSSRCAALRRATHARKALAPWLWIPLATDILPAPRGYYLDGVFKCTVIMCRSGDSVAPCEQNQMCDYSSFEGSFMSRPVNQGESTLRGMDLPSACPAGVLGNSVEARHQSGPSCAAPCNAGHWCPAASKEEIPCPAGTTSHAGSGVPTACQSCSAGRFAASEGSTQCTSCDVGTYQPSLGATSCQHCDEGSYCLRGSTSPVPCEASGVQTHAAAPIRS